jgi:hypothetical protein
MNFKQRDENAGEWQKDASCLILTETRHNKFQAQKRILIAIQASMTDEQQKKKRRSTYLLMYTQARFVGYLKTGSRKEIFPGESKAHDTVWSQGVVSKLLTSL